MNVIKKSKREYCEMKNVAYGEINERSFSNTLPRTYTELQSPCFPIWHL